jgi:hypothetical protein
MRFYYPVLLILLILNASIGYSEDQDTDISELTRGMDPALVKRIEENVKALNSKEPESVNSIEQLPPFLRSAAEHFQKENAEQIKKITEKKNSEDNFEDLQAGTIYKHIKEEGGVVFASSGAALTSFKDPELLASVQADQKAGQEKLMALLNSAKLPPKCAAAERSKEPLAKEIPAAKQGIIDIMFAAKDELGDAPDLSFGKKTRIIRISNDPNDANLHIISVLPVGCLPYRMRAAGSSFIRERGEFALRNYDANPEGEGVPVDLSDKKEKKDKEAQ